MRIIGFTGKKGHGKSTASEKIKDMLMADGQEVVRINFKDALVSTMREKLSGTLGEMAILLNTNVDMLFFEKPPMMRKLMQEFGTEIYRSFDNNYWINQWMEKVKSVGEDVVIIVDDVRFQNEFDMIKNMGGSVTRIVATNKDRAEDEHQSEKEQDSFETNITISANGKEQLELLIVENLTVL